MEVGAIWGRRSLGNGCSSKCHGAAFFERQKPRCPAVWNRTPLRRNPHASTPRATSPAVAAKGGWLPLAIVIVWPLVVFSRVVGCELVKWDDNYHLWENPYFQPLTWGHLAHCGTSRTSVNTCRCSTPGSPARWWLLELVTGSAQECVRSARVSRRQSAAARRLQRARVSPARSFFFQSLGGQRRALCCASANGDGRGCLGERSTRVVGDVLWTVGDLALLRSGFAGGVANGKRDRGAFWSGRRGVHYAIATLALALALASKPSAVSVPLIVGVLDCHSCIAGGAASPRR